MKVMGVGVDDVVGGGRKKKKERKEKVVCQVWETEKSK